MGTNVVYGEKSSYGDPRLVTRNYVYDVLYIIGSCVWYVQVTVRIGLAGEAQDSAWTQTPCFTLEQNEWSRPVPFGPYRWDRFKTHAQIGKRGVRKSG